MKQLIILSAFVIFISSCTKTKIDYLTVTKTDTVTQSNHGLTGSWSSISPDYSNWHPVFTADSLTLFGIGYKYLTTGDSVYLYLSPTTMSAFYAYHLSDDQDTLTLNGNPTTGVPIEFYRVQ